MTRVPIPRLVLPLLAAAALTACGSGGIGEGNRIETLKIDRQTGLLDTEDNRSFLCLTDKLRVVGEFSDGGTADYTTRANWTSSNPDVVAVSNGDILVPGTTDLAYSAGTIIPKQVTATPVTITADFVGLTTSYDVVVEAIDPATFTYEPAASPLRMASKTILRPRIYAEVDGYRIDVTQAARWTISPEDNPHHEDIDDVGKISYASDGSVLIEAVDPDVNNVGANVRAEFVNCSGANAPASYERLIKVEDPASLLLEREFNNDLIVGNTERMQVTAVFADGATQDVTGQAIVNVDSSSEDVIVPGSASAPQFITAIDAGTSVITAVYGGDGDPTTPTAKATATRPEVKSNPVTITTVDGSLTDFTIAPASATIEALHSQQFTATGTFSVSGQDVTQAITRGVTWSVTQPDDTATSEVVISNAFVNKGLATSVDLDTTRVEVKATWAASDPDIVKEAALCVTAPGEACPAP